MIKNKSVSPKKCKEQIKTEMIWRYISHVDSPFHIFDGNWNLKYKNGVMTIVLED